jgi:hypothetical protein
VSDRTDKCLNACMVGAGLLVRRWGGEYGFLGEYMN